MIEHLNSVSLLAAGGITAAVVAGWQHVKNIFSYLSSYIVVSAVFEEQIGTLLVRHLRRHWKLVPNGNWYYLSKMYETQDPRLKWLLVPYKMPNQRAIYVKGLAAIVVTVDGHHLKITSLRGMVDIQALAKRAVLEYNDMKRLATEPDRFSIYEIIGVEKTYGRGSDGVSPKRKRGGDAIPSESGVAENSTVGSFLTQVDKMLDDSFAYDREQYVFPSNYDPFKNVYFPPEVETVINQARRWYDSREWFADRSIPWRRGFLLHGPGGTGKSTMAKALGIELKIPIYQFYFDTLSNQEFISAWKDMQTPCIALFEDFDTVFDGRTPVTEHKSLTFDCILNCISGVNSQDGVLLIVTTNHIEKIDPARGVSSNNGSISTRPGRIDTVVYVGYMQEPQRRKMAHRILKDWPEIIDEMVAKGENMTPAQFQELCTQVAFERLHLETVK